MPTLDDQIRHEIEMVRAGIERFQHSTTKAIERGKESDTPHGRVIVARAVDAVAAGIKEFLETKTSNRDVAKKRLEGMNPEHVAYLALINIVDALAKRFTILNVATHVAEAVEMQRRLDQWIAEDPNVAKKIIKQAQEKTTFKHAKNGLTHKMNKDGYKHTTWTTEDRRRVGLRLISIVIETTGLVTTTRLQTTKGKTTTYLEATPETIEWIRGFNEKREGMLPKFAPCIIKPKPWTDVWGGGYYSDQIRSLPIVRAH